MEHVVSRVQEVGGPVEQVVDAGLWMTMRLTFCSSAVRSVRRLGAPASVAAWISPSRESSQFR